MNRRNFLQIIGASTVIVNMPEQPQVRPLGRIQRFRGLESLPPAKFTINGVDVYTLTEQQRQTLEDFTRIMEGFSLSVRPR